MFDKGDRVELVFTADPHTRLKPGDRGTVVWVSENLGDIDIDVNWDSGSRLSMIPSSGDRIRKVSDE